MIAGLSLIEELSRRDFALSTPQVIIGGIATLVTIVCVIFHYEVMSWSSRLLSHLHLKKRPRIVALMFLLMTAHVIEVWIYGITFWVLDQWPEFGHLQGTFDEGAMDFIYFSVTTFTTLGFGDIVPEGPVRILTGGEALTGLGLITWSASLAFLEMQRDWVEFRRPKD